MATQQPSSALRAPALSPAYPMANPGYGKRSAPGQRPRTPQDFALLPVRERYVAGFVDHLPDGAAMSVKQLAKQLPLYGQQAISTALTALSVAGHLRRVRCPVGAGDETRWVSRTFWSRTARDNEWWNAYLATETATKAAAPAPEATTPPPWVPDEEPPPAPEDPGLVQDPGATAVPQQRTPVQAPDAVPAPPAPDAAPAAPQAPEAGPSPAYLALARLGRTDHRLALSADDCAALEAQAAEWLNRGVSVDYLTSALTAGLPTKVDSPVGLLRRRLTDKMPPRLLAENTSPDAPAPTTRRILMECTDCGRPGRPEHLPDGLCRPCRTTHTAEAPAQPAEVPEVADIKARMANLRDLLKPV
ncbi:MarR family transcriptional regulator [Streptomyces griseus]|uniref:MarR family transcriptional regulator n=2 Tax=Streptomyces TaxID=1883 RepID=A0ABU2W6W7_9ACTN|nr:MarR family transcriptional regulator [Streptomyces griseus]MDT0493349.1 MarR family transcriptional regulator [Streptomyces griseus]